jgi:hypothetical protein
MAYFSGNALYVRAPQLNASFTQCGGVSLENNTFYGNIGLKIHNGGAISFICSDLVQKHDDLKVLGSPIGSGSNRYNSRILGSFSLKDINYLNLYNNTFE